MQLSIRMQAVADMVTPGGRIADIGTDHGYVPIYLVEQNKADHAIAMDVRKGQMARAGENIVRFGCSDRIESGLSDGLAMLNPGEADTVIIAGMGGVLTIRILERGPKVLQSVSECILQPQSDLDKVRQFLHQDKKARFSLGLAGRQQILYQLEHADDVPPFPRVLF